MANKPLQSIKFPNLPDTYTVPVVDSTLAVSGAAADAKKTGDELAKKVNAVSGKGLSTNDFTTTEKNKLSGIESGANKTVIDSTLAVSGNAADAKAVGDALAVVDRNAYGAYIIPTASGPIAHFTDGADNIPMKDVLVHIEPVQAGSGDPSPDNVRPITGWTAARVTRVGKNLLPNNLVSRTANGVTYVKNSDGSITINGTATNSFDIPVYGSGSSDLKPFPYSDKPITLSGCPVGGGTSSYRLGGYLYKNGQYTGSTIIDVGDSKTVRDVDFDQIYIMLFVYSGYTFNNLTFYPMIEYGTSPTAYEPYSGQTYDITFPTEAGTVYGGTLDVTSGVLTVDRAMVDLGTLTWMYNATYAFFISNSLTDRKSGVTNMVSDLFKTETGSWSGAPKTNVLWGNGSNGNIYVQFPITEVSEFLSIISGHQLVYELATPITYQLTPQEITSLLGTNNLWADCGDTEVEYRADTTLYISRLTEPDADMIADANITSGQYFMVGNSLYRATSNIASGASVVVGTNAVKVSLATALNEINQ